MGLNHIQTVSPLRRLLQLAGQPPDFLILQRVGSGYGNHFHHFHDLGAGFLHFLAESPVLPVDF